MISFNIRKAADQLLNRGVVYTMRRNRPEGWTDLYVMRKRIGWVHVELIGPVRDMLLAPYVARSGFETYQEWMAAAKRAHGTNAENLLIYKVTIAKEEYGHGTEKGSSGA